MEAGDPDLAIRTEQAEEPAREAEKELKETAAA